MKRTESLWLCPDCFTKWTKAQMLRARNPFDNDPESPPITGCPSCLGIVEWRELCDEEGCECTSTCGTPTGDGGYRRTCGKHAPSLYRPADHRDGSEL